MFRIRFHGRGGQGMKTASRILGKSFFLEGYEVQDAPRYGAERRGAPMFAYVRAALDSIYERGVIQNPDLVLVADESLVAVPAAGVMQGCSSSTVILINSAEKAELWQDRLNFKGPIVPLAKDSAVAMRYSGVACAGAAAGLVGTIKKDTLEQAIREELTDLGESIVAANVENALAAYAQMVGKSGLVKEGSPIAVDECQAPPWINMSCEVADQSAPAIHAAATTEKMKTGLWRTKRPEIDYKRCNRCWWLCSTFCPEGAIHLNEERFPQIDYEHCKGCLICLAQCPPHAVSVVSESDQEK